MVEWVAGAVLFIPLLICIIFVVLEISRAYSIKVALDAASKRAARQLAIDYGVDPINNITNAHQQAVFTTVRIPTFVMDNTQFSAAAYALGPVPPTVSVTVSYPAAGIAGVLPPFPDPDPLNIRSTIQINSIATYPLY